jgi:hypothetical protein
MEWLGRLVRLSASPAAARAILDFGATLDVRDVLDRITCPTLVLHRRHDQWVHPENARYLATHIPGSRLVELDGADHWPWFGDTDSILRPLEKFLGRLAPTAAGAFPRVRTQRFPHDNHDHGHRPARSPYGDPYARIAELDDATSAALARRFEIRAADPRQHRLWTEFLARAPRVGPARVLEVGCGTGIITAKIAELPGVARRSPRIGCPWWCRPPQPPDPPGHAVGRMFALRWNTFPGSYSALIRASRAYLGP